jgi:sugar fermentation stimulation protein A
MIPQDARIARFLARSNRFVLRCDLDGKTIDAYLPNPGRLWELLLPGCVLYLARNRGGVKLPYTVVAMEKDGIPILLHTHLANDAAETLLRRGLVPGLEDARILRREATFGDSRSIFSSRRTAGRWCWR